VLIPTNRRSFDCAPFGHSAQDDNSKNVGTLHSFGGVVVVFVVLLVEWSGQDKQADAGYVEGFRRHQVLGALAQLGHADMGVAAEFEAGGNEHAVDFEADGAGEFKAHLHGVGAGHAARQDPSAAGEHGAGQEAHHALRVVGAGCGQPEVPFYEFICI